MANFLYHFDREGKVQDREGASTLVNHTRGRYLVLTKDVLGSKIPRTWTALNVYIRWYSDPLKSEIKYCFKVVVPFKKTVQGTRIVLTPPIGIESLGVELWLD